MGFLYRYLAFLDRYVYGFKPAKTYSLSDVIIHLTFITFILLPVTTFGKGLAWLDQKITVSD